MFMSLDPAARASTATTFSVPSEARDLNASSQPWYLRAPPLLGIWAALSVMWTLAVGYDVCQRVTMQADMSRDVEADLNQGFVNANCAGAQCAGSASTARTQNWSGIASTYIKFGSDEMAECVFGPPAALLVIGLGTIFVLRRRAAKGA